MFALTSKTDSVRDLLNALKDVSLAAIKAYYLTDIAMHTLYILGGQTVGRNGVCMLMYNVYKRCIRRKALRQASLNY